MLTVSAVINIAIGGVLLLLFTYPPLRMIRDDRKLFRKTYADDIQRGWNLIQIVYSFYIYIYYAYICYIKKKFSITIYVYVYRQIAVFMIDAYGYPNTNLNRKKIVKNYFVNFYLSPI